MMVEMSSPGDSWHIVKDVQSLAVADHSRWTDQQPTVRILAVATDGLRLSVDFSLWPVAMQQTGPVDLSFVVNDRLIERVRYDTPGQKHFETLIPPDCVATDVESSVSVSIDKLYTAPLDGKKFGFILSRIGFVQ